MRQQLGLLGALIGALALACVPEPSDSGESDATTASTGVDDGTTGTTDETTSTTDETTSTTDETTSTTDGTTGTTDGTAGTTDEPLASLCEPSCAERAKCGEDYDDCITGCHADVDWADGDEHLTDCASELYDWLECSSLILSCIDLDYCRAIEEDFEDACRCTSDLLAEDPESCAPLPP